MLHAISWSVFLMAVVCMALAYWLVISMVYYSRELKVLVSGKSPNSKDAKQSSNSNFFVGDGGPSEIRAGGGGGDDRMSDHSKLDVDQGNNTGLFPVAYRLVDELREVITEYTDKKSAREELLYAIQRVLNKNEYKDLKQTAFKVAINNMIEGECLSKASMNLSGEELNFIWKK
jgi:hypothetical protein